MANYYTPAQTFAIANFRESPFCCMFGCAEKEAVAKKIVEWLADNGNTWDTPLPPLEQFGTARELSHGHWGGTEKLSACNFQKEFIDNESHTVNERFVKSVQILDGRRLRADVLHTLRPDLFPKAVTNA